MMLFATEQQAVAAAESMTEAARGARAVIAYRVYYVGGARPYRVTDDMLRGFKLVAWCQSDGETARRLIVGR